MNDDSQETSELDWLAFRYIAGELTPDEASRFEERLANDQPAREAVSRASALGVQLASGSPVAIRDARFAGRAIHALTWASIGAAASLVGWMMLQPGQVPEAQRPRAPQPVEAQVDAIAWMQLRGVTAAGVDRQFEESILDESLDLQPSREAIVPAWMLNVPTTSKTERKQ